MDKAVSSTKRWRAPRWAIRSMLAGIALALASFTAILMLPNANGAAAEPAPIIRLPGVFPTATLASDALIQRQAVIDILPTPSPTIAPTEIPVKPPVIEWSDAEKNILSWVCYGEVGGMREKKIDACYSVISTIRARYAYNSPFHDADIISVLERAGQFPGLHWEDGRPSPDPELMWAVNQYQAGSRGSCTGYLYFDSVPGGPALCSIYSSNNQFMEFHNGWH